MGRFHARSIMTAVRIGNPMFSGRTCAPERAADKSALSNMARLFSNRSSGVLLHITSLPSPFGIGDLGDEARAFVDFLQAAGQTLWQILPLGPTGCGNSPYQTLSAFAGNALLIDPRHLAADRLIAEDDLAAPESDEARVDFDLARGFKIKLLRTAYDNFKHGPFENLRQEFEEFCERTAWWLDDYSLFCALKDAQGGRNWTDWDSEFTRRSPPALDKARADLTEEVRAQKFFQFLFFRQWKALSEYARARQIKIIGDLPIFVAHDSADVWAHQEYFKLDENGRPLVVAGVPPDYFSETGQLWGNPLYDWERLRADGFKWWIDRFRWSLELFDLVRVDHFRGFAACWEIPADQTTAQNGQWIDTPGRELFSTVQKTLGDLPIIAENLGVITQDVEKLRADFGFPGMRVLQFAFDGEPTNVHLPHNHSRDSVVYTGTHDNDTTIGWFATLAEDERDACLKCVNGDREEINWGLIRAAMSSVAETAIIPMQDVLGLGSEARMNLPASETGNWLWRMKDSALSEDLSMRLRKLSELYGRIAAA